MEPMFPDWEERHPHPKPKREPKLWKATATQERILNALARGPRSDRELHEYLVETWSDARPGQTTLAATQRAVDGFAKRGLVRDVGQRGQWTHKGREIIWHFVDAEEETA